jgi:hypothetical protein
MDNQADASLRRITGFLGMGALATGVFTLLAPDLYAWLTGGSTDGKPGMRAIYRSVAFRDIGTGAGLWSASAHDGKIAPWLLVRAIAHGGDALATLLAILGGNRDGRTIGFALMSAVESATAFNFWRQASQG